MRIGWAAFGLAALLAGAAGQSQQPIRPAAVPAWPHLASDIPADPAVRFGTLPNGMRYAIRRNARPVGEASVRLRIDAGSLHEADDQRGLAHFLEHVVLNGTTNVPEGEFVRRLERHGMRFGADTNATTDPLQTIFRLDLPETDDDTVDTALFLLREVAGEAVLAPAAIERERGIVQAEARTRDLPNFRVFVDETGYMMPGLRVAERMPIGDPDIIARAAAPSLRAYYDAYYRPERATLVMVGDFDLDRVEARIRAAFGGWRGRGAAGREPDRGTVQARPEEARIRVEPVGGPRVTLSWVRPPDLAPDMRARRTERLVDGIALQILNRRLQLLVTEQSPPPFISAGAQRQEIAESAEITQVTANVRPDEWRRGLVAIENEQRRLVTHGVTTTEVARALTQVRTSLDAAVAGAATIGSAAIADGIVGTIDRDNVYAAPAEQLRLFEAIAPGITPERVGEAARRLFAGPPLLYQVLPAPLPGGEPALMAAYREAGAMTVAASEARPVQPWPYDSFGTPGAIAERRTLPEPVGATAVRFANSVRLTIKRTDFTDGQVLVSARFGDGRLALPVDRPNPNWGLGIGLISGGLGRLSVEDMQETLAGRIYRTDFDLNDDHFAINGLTRPADLAVQLQAMAAYFSDPGWRDAHWRRARSMSAQVHNQMESTPAGVLARDGEPLLRGGDRRWRVASRQEMAASTIADLRAVLDGPLASAPIEITIVGDVDVESAIREAAATFGALPPRAAGQARDERIRFSGGGTAPVVLFHRGSREQALAFLAWPTLGFFDDTRQVRALNLLGSLFQLRLTDRVREQLGAAYVPLAGHNASEAFAGYGTFAARVEGRPERIEDFFREVGAIAADLRERPAGADEVQRARQQLLERIERDRRTNIWWLRRLRHVQTDPRIAQVIAIHIEDYRDIGADELQRAARTYLGDGGALRIMVMPAPAPAAQPAT